MRDVKVDYKNKKLLITGGTGSFGNKMLRYFLQNTDIEEIRVFSRDEEKQDRMRAALNDVRIKYYIGDVRNFNSINNALNGVDIVFHAAALKQVPSCEFFPMEAVATNVYGSDNVLNAAVQNKVRNIVMLSTDKAVNPINSMGMTKALMEKVAIAKARNTNPDNTIIAVTRYGNVMASRGSVIPLFIRQCKENLPITITDPNMTIFLMSLEESVNLVLYAFEHATTGDIFVQKAPASTIYDLALAVQRIFNAKNEIKIIGTRHGEKAHEILVSREELQKAEELDGFFRIPADIRDLNYDKYFKEGNEDVQNGDDYNSFNTRRLSVDEIVDKLMSLQYIKEELKAKAFIGVAK